MPCTRLGNEPAPVRRTGRGGEDLLKECQMRSKPGRRKGQGYELFQSLLQISGRIGPDCVGLRRMGNAMCIACITLLTESRTRSGGTKHQRADPLAMFNG